MSTGNIVVSQDAPAKNNLWIQPKGTARFWNGSIWKTISGGGGGDITLVDLMGSSAIGTQYNPLYWTGSVFSPITYTLSSAVNSGTANRLAYYTSSGIDDASTTYVSNTKLAINSTSEPSYNFYVNGTSYLNGATSHASGHIYLTGSNASSSVSNTTQLVFGTSSTNHVVLSANTKKFIINPSTSSTTGQISLGVNGENSYFSSSGNFGIGTDSPTYKLDVRGTSYFNSTMTVTSTGSNRATLKLKTYGDYPNDFILGTNDTDRWSITCRESSDGGLGFYNYVVGAYRMKILQNGNVGIGTTSPPQKLSVDGNIYASGGVTALQTVSSDKRLKKNIKKFKAKDIIDKLNPVSFEWNNKAKKLSDFKDGTNYGLIAQDSDGIIDNFVFDLPDGKGYKGVRYDKLIPILLQAVKEQQSEINELKQIIKKLKV